MGRETRVANTSESNIRLLANMVGKVQYSSKPDQDPAQIHPILPHGSRSRQYPSPDIVAGYQEGVGLNGTFLEYVFNGATASDIGKECINVYKFIVENYTDEHEIWMFGYSRGAFTLRCVAGMINNCGILRRLEEYTTKEVDRLCYELFRTYRSEMPSDAPKSTECERVRSNVHRVWQVKQPIRFMGLIDTVGALGIPRLNAGIGIDWSRFEFFDQHASSVIQHVYHAPALHDRLWTFQPCPILPSTSESCHGQVVKEMWLPGTHYDVGRMAFRFVRQHPTNWIEGLLGWLPDLLSRTIYPNEVLSDTVLRWMVESVRDVDADSENPIMPNIDQRIQHLSERLSDGRRSDTGSGDIYGDVIDYAPGGVVLGFVQRATRMSGSLLNRVMPRLGDHIQNMIGIKLIVGVLTATADRRIPDVEAKLYPYKDQESVFVGAAERIFSVEQAAGMRGQNEWGRPRYASKTYESFLLWKRVFGRKAPGSC